MNKVFKKWSLKCQGALLLACLMLLVVVGGAAAQVAPTLVDPNYRKPILTPQSQVSTIWTNVAPNALADYYTYVPFKNADAVALGFPSTCGNPNAVGATAADLASTDDCYSISAKKFQQQLALPGIFGGGAGLINPATNTPFGAITWVYGYGSGGANWVLPYYDTAKPGVVANTPVTGNAPAPFADGTFASTGIWHFPAPSFKNTKGRPVRIQWLNELPNEIPTGFDPSICGSVPSNCFPYNRIVTHVHGSHVGPESDGQVHAWFTPGFSQTGPLWESTRRHGPEGTYYYPMDQEAGTIWYHDHATGTTHTSTNMGLAGFFAVTDANEQLLQTNNILPTGTRELGFALQDRIFYEDGQQAMPDAPILDPAFAATCTYATDPNTGLPATDPATGGVLVTSAPSTCSPVFMKDPINGNLVPYPAVPGTPAPAAYLATSATLEFFGNIPVVNGVTYAKYNVDRGVYRIRLIGGTDSRTWALRLKVAGSNPARYLPFWQIGSEQGLLNTPVKLDNLLILAGERVDVLVDFNSAETLDASGASAGPLNLANARIVLENWAGDAPYGGEPILPASDPAAIAFRSVDIPEIMAFDVSAATVPVDVITPSTATSLRPSIPAVPNLTLNPPPAATPVRTVSLVEIVDQYQRIMPTLDGRGFLDFGVSELPKLNVTEQWDIINTTVDAHPIHLHQVAFQLINRETIDTNCPASLLAPLCVNPASTTIAPPYSSAVVTAYQPNSIVTPLPEEIGFKDTILCPPGTVTRVIATFDIPGTYVWHCHILSHEEHDMMRPLVVTTPATSITLTGSGTSQPTGATMAPVTLTAQAFTGIAAYPLGNGFEYDFAVTGPVANLPQPTRVAPSFYSSLGDSFNVVNVASWTPPTTTGVYTITARTKAMGAVNAGNPIKTATINYTVTPPLAVTTTTLPSGTVGVFYWKQLAATGGIKPYTWAQTAGTLPAGLTMYPSGVIRGTPTTAGTFNFTVKVTAANGSTATQALSITVTAKTLTITTTTLADGKVGVFYWKQLTATGATTPYTWAKTAGTLPAGLTMYPSGVIRGAPTAAGTFNFTVMVTAANGSTATQALSITVAAKPVTITTTALADGKIGVFYWKQLTATGGTTPYTWTKTSGTLPAGLTMYPSGVIRGAPTTAGTFNFTVKVTAANGSTATKALSIKIAP